MRRGAVAYDRKCYEADIPRHDGCVRLKEKGDCSGRMVLLVLPCLYRNVFCGFMRSRGRVRAAD